MALWSGAEMSGCTLDLVVWWQKYCCVEKCLSHLCTPYTFCNLTDDWKTCELYLNSFCHDRMSIFCMVMSATSLLLILRLRRLPNLSPSGPNLLALLKWQPSTLISNWVDFQQVYWLLVSCALLPGRGTLSQWLLLVYVHCTSEQCPLQLYHGKYRYLAKPSWVISFARCGLASLPSERIAVIKIRESIYAVLMMLILKHTKKIMLLSGMKVFQSSSHILCFFTWSESRTTRVFWCGKQNIDRETVSILNFK